MNIKQADTGAAHRKISAQQYRAARDNKVGNISHRQSDQGGKAEGVERAKGGENLRLPLPPAKQEHQQQHPRCRSYVEQKMQRCHRGIDSNRRNPVPLGQCTPQPRTHSPGHRRKVQAHHPAERGQQWRRGDLVHLGSIPQHEARDRDAHHTQTHAKT